MKERESLTRSLSSYYLTVHLWSTEVDLWNLIYKIGMPTSIIFDHAAFFTVLVPCHGVLIFANGVRVDAPLTIVRNGDSVSVTRSVAGKDDFLVFTLKVLFQECVSATAAA